MIEQTQLQGQNTARRFRRLYLIALSLIAALAIGGQILVQLSLTSQLGDGHIVNQAGSQRMLSQRITLKMMLHDATTPEAQAQLETIAAMRDRWVATHEQLATSVDRVAYGPLAQTTLSSLLRDVDGPLRHIAGLVTKQVASGQLTEAERTALMADQELFLPLMDAVVSGFEHSVQARVAFLQRVEITLLIITLVVLALEALLIFRPAVNRLQSSLRELEHRNQQSTRRLESLRHLAGGIAHNFNNLLTGIMGNADLERIDALQKGRNTEYLDAQVSGCKRAAEIITHLVAYSGHGRYDLEPVELGAWLTELVRSSESISSSVTLKLDIAEDALANVDRSALRSALDGVILNATEAMKGQSGVVHLNLAQVMLAEPRLMSGPYRSELPLGLYARVQVVDHGKGIAPDELDHIFDPYYSRKEFGRGLGLASVLGIVHGHDGGIEVSSTAGRGSIVSIYLPLSSHPVVSPELSKAKFK